ncbi:MAG: flagellar protein FlgN [Proteobacteria bacterium]|nr:flagellar protein FlgN [Pseudomonadota bacterium]
MNNKTPFATLADALDTELSLLTELRDLGVAAHHPLVTLDLPCVERWTRKQHVLLNRLADAAVARADLQEACLPERARGLAGSGGLAATVTLHALIARAPHGSAERLRQQRDALRQLRDEIAAISARNEALTRQVLEMTDHLGEGLQNATRSSSYDARGQGAEVSLSGDLFTGAI